GIGITEQHWICQALESGEERLGLFSCLAAKRNGMVSNEQGRPPKVDPQAALKLSPAEQNTSPQVIERGRSGAMHTPLFFAHGDDAGTRLIRRREVDVAHLGERIPYRIVDGSLADFATFDV